MKPLPFNAINGAMGLTWEMNFPQVTSLFYSQKLLLELLPQNTPKMTFDNVIIYI
jgi:hypothetical protein